MFKDCLFIFCFQSSAAYHASLAHKTNHSFLPNGLFKYFDRYALSTQRLFHFLKVHFAHCTFRPICCVRPPQIWSHTLYINNCRHRRRGRGKNKLYCKSIILAPVKSSDQAFNNGDKLALYMYDDVKLVDHQILVGYGYDLDESPEWYKVAWKNSIFGQVKSFKKNSCN